MKFKGLLVILVAVCSIALGEGIIKVGDPESQVVAALGNPQGSFPARGATYYMYDFGNISVRDGKVESLPDGFEAAMRQEELANVTKTTPEIKAELSKFGTGWGGLFFTLSIRNLTPNKKTVVAYVYGKNEDITPPLYRVYGIIPVTGHAVSPREISESWNVRKEFQRGAEIVLKPYGTDSFEAELGLNSVAPNGKKYPPNSGYNVLSLWIFSEPGQLIYEKTYRVGS